MKAISRQCLACDKMQPHYGVTANLRLKFDLYLGGEWITITSKGLICEGCGHVQLDRETSQEFLGKIRDILRDELVASKIREEEGIRKQA